MSKIDPMLERFLKTYEACCDEASAPVLKMKTIINQSVIKQLRKANKLKGPSKEITNRLFLLGERHIREGSEGLILGFIRSNPSMIGRFLDPGYVGKKYHRLIILCPTWAENLSVLQKHLMSFDSRIEGDPASNYHLPGKIVLVPLKDHANFRISAGDTNRQVRQQSHAQEFVPNSISDQDSQCLYAVHHDGKLFLQFNNRHSRYIVRRVVPFALLLIKQRGGGKQGYARYNQVGKAYKWNLNDLKNPDPKNSQRKSLFRRMHERTKLLNEALKVLGLPIVENREGGYRLPTVVPKAEIIR